MIKRPELRNNYRNIWCILRSIDRHEVRFGNPARNQEWDDFDWVQFRDDPHGFFIRCDTRTADAIWAAVEKRLEIE